MKVFHYCLIIILTAGYILPTQAQGDSHGRITVLVVDKSTGSPIPFVNVALHSARDSAIVTGGATDRNGRVAIADAPFGRYFLSCRIIGYVPYSTGVFTLDAQHPSMNTGTIRLTATTVDLEEYLVTGEKSVFTTSIDRKVYNVGQDLRGNTGSASELLQNVPSVQVDIDGNVSLRGSTGVMFLLNGKTSPLLDKNSAEALQQLPATSIDRIEIITNPSARYKPDGTAGIINIVLKKNTFLGLSGSVAANAGVQDRYNGSLRLNNQSGPWNFSGNYSVRRDSRNRFNNDKRTITDSLMTVTGYTGATVSGARPLSHLISLACDYKAGESDQAGLSGNYFRNGFVRTEMIANDFRSSSGMPLNEYTRGRYDEEYEDEFEGAVYFQHDLPGEDNSVRLDYTISRSPEQEDNRYTDTYFVPAIPQTFDNTLLNNTDTRHQASLVYSGEPAAGIRVETGYEMESNLKDVTLNASVFDTARGLFVTDAGRSNDFRYDEYIHAVFATAKRSFGSFGLMAGARVEYVSTNSDLRTLDSTLTNTYTSFYPSLHCSYNLNPALQLQLSYSRRTHRPDDEDVNPFPEYRDPRNIQAGNPALLPEYVHSVELGCQYQAASYSVTPALFYRRTSNRFTSVTSRLNDTTLLTTMKNLSEDQSGGVEFVLSGNIGEAVATHWSWSGYYNEIDASNLGYGSTKSTTTWSSSLTVTLSPSKGTRVQVNAGYNSRRLSAQGEYKPSSIVNLGFRQELITGKLFLTATGSDIFRTSKRELELNIPGLQQTVVNSRDARVIMVGLTYRFGSTRESQKEEQLQYDNGM